MNWGKDEHPNQHFPSILPLLCCSHWTCFFGRCMKTYIEYDDLRKISFETFGNKKNSIWKISREPLLYCVISFAPSSWAEIGRPPTSYFLPSLRHSACSGDAVYRKLPTGYLLLAVEKKTGTECFSSDENWKRELVGDHHNVKFQIWKNGENVDRSVISNQADEYRRSHLVENLQ